MVMNYNILSQDYDLTRDVNIDTIKKILSKVTAENPTILDFGCGTGNYTWAVKKVSDANIFGVEPSDGMREKAQQKGTEIEFKKGDHTSIPFRDDIFDLIYMTDVIHHVPDLNSMFTEFFRVLNPNGKICILTESHNQIETRFWSSYFPTMATAEKERYPDIPEIISVAKKCGLSVDENINTDKNQTLTISPEFVTLVENKGFSMFRLISEDEFSNGLKRLKEDYNNKVEIKSTHGETFLWLKKYWK
ncbi:MAG: methyltransferase domain-containing protein [Defluviitaleaceae bacterium]|nr:methyltransferase domain-containing protein [Defluviitaleaceae bacterium]